MTFPTFTTKVGNMDSARAFARGTAARLAGSPLRVFDWNKAAKIIRDTPCSEASAGLSGDWEWTGGVIYRDGRVVPPDETYTYLQSNWATPELDLDGVVQDCWIYAADSEGWNAKTYWPTSALAILEGR